VAPQAVTEAPTQATEAGEPGLHQAHGHIGSPVVATPEVPDFTGDQLVEKEEAARRTVSILGVEAQVHKPILGASQQLEHGRHVHGQRAPAAAHQATHHRQWLVRLDLTHQAPQGLDALLRPESEDNVIPLPGAAQVQAVPDLSDLPTDQLLAELLRRQQQSASLSPEPLPLEVAAP
jgi:hypothetical protein